MDGQEAARLPCAPWHSSGSGIHGSEHGQAFPSCPVGPTYASDSSAAAPGLPLRRSRPPRAGRVSTTATSAAVTNEKGDAPSHAGALKPLAALTAAHNDAHQGTDTRVHQLESDEAGNPRQQGHPAGSAAVPRDPSAPG